jgi:pimeloyl-ACP methyl ester carboxylesterase
MITASRAVDPGAMGCQPTAVTVVESLDVDGSRLAFRRSGSGPPLVLLHGAVSDSRVWRRELESFADEFTVVAWDAPGCGESADVPGSPGMPDYAALLAGLLDGLGIGAAHVLGHSWGSTLALELALLRPDLVRSLVLVGGYAGWAGSLPADEVQRRLTFALQTADRIGDFDPTTMPGLFSSAMPGDRATELAHVMSEIRPTATREMAHALALADLRDALPRIAAPTLVVAGSSDERSPVSVGSALAEAIPGARLAVLEGLGHECYLESPEAFAAAVRPFFDGRRGGPEASPRETTVS